MSKKTTGLLTVQCWCQDELVEVTQEDVAQGLTLPCYQKRCKDMDERARRRT